MKLTSGHTLKALMQQKGVSLNDMALATDRSKGFISHLTAGRKTTCSPMVADRIARRLDVPLELLFVPSPPISVVQAIPQQRRRAA